MTPEEADAKLEVGDIIRHKKTKLRAQVMNHFSDSADYVQVILFPQPGVTGNARFSKWHKDECERIRDNQGTNADHPNNSRPN